MPGTEPEHFADGFIASENVALDEMEDISFSLCVHGTIAITISSGRNAKPAFRFLMGPSPGAQFGNCSTPSREHFTKINIPQ